MKHVLVGREICRKRPYVAMGRPQRQRVRRSVLAWARGRDHLSTRQASGHGAPPGRAGRPRMRRHAATTNVAIACDGLQEFCDFLRCGVLACGFARVRCGDCDFERLVPFSCKGRASVRAAVAAAPIQGRVATGPRAGARVLRVCRRRTRVRIAASSRATSPSVGAGSGWNWSAPTASRRVRTVSRRRRLPRSIPRSVRRRRTPAAWRSSRTSWRRAAGSRP